MLKVGHRGAPRVAPANTMASFRAAVEMGCNWVECDCRPSSDGIIMLAHEEYATDACGDTYPIAEHTAAELAALDLGHGEGVPTLEQLVSFALGWCGVMADVKCEGSECEIGAILAPLSTANKVVPGAGPRGRLAFRRFHPHLPLSLSVGADDEALLLAEWDALDTEAVTLQHPLVTADRVDALHRRGIRVFAWTVDDLPTLQRLAAMGVDGLISNRADLLALL